LTTHDSVFAAAPDGGYWGIGLRAPDPRVFEGVPMSTESTGAAQRARMAALGLDPLLLPPLTDVDTHAEAYAVAAQAPRTRFAAALEGIAA
jgi:glycosyltransferase A (GT-A) superfamily protein (DUF2064 family)